MQNPSFNTKKNTWRRHFLFYLVILAVVGSFGLGLVFGEETVRKNYLNDGQKAVQKDSVNTDIIWEVWKKLNDKYVGDLPANDKMVYGMAKGMVGSLGDPYTIFMEPDKSKEFKDDLNGSFEGIGAEIGMKHDVLTIVSPIKGTPAEKAGLKAGDKIVKINDKDTNNMELDDAVSQIRGEKNTNVKLSVISEDDPNPKEVEVTRGVIDVKSTDWELKNGDIAYVRLSSFSQDTTKEFTEIARKIKESNAKKIILDLRGNPGGYLTTAVDLAGFFLPNNTLVVTEDFGGKHPSVNYTTTINPVLDKYPLVVLTDKGSASAAEILAGALNEQKGAKLVGEKTYGKGSVQEFINLSDGSTLKVTVAQWLTPQGKCINKEGISPDVEVGITSDDIKDKKDPQLDKAIETVNGL